MLENFNAKKQKLLDAYARLAKSGLVFSDGVDENTLKDRASKLENEEFILAIAGQMKAGTYKLSFDTKGYWQKRGQESFYPYVEVRARRVEA